VAKARSAADTFLDRRLRAQRLSSPMPPDPAAVVAWFGAVQAQDYQGAKWALALRAPGLTDAQLDAALADGTIIRTHGPRPTWHFIAAADARWVLSAVAPRVQVRSQTMYRAHEIDAALMTKARRVFEKALAGKRFTTRTALAAALAAKGIQASGVRLGMIVFWAELEQWICSGPRAGKQFTYALFDERVPAAPPVPAADAQVALAARYVASHGPATVNDFVWWSGLTVGEARRALEGVAPALVSETFDGKTYWSTATLPPAGDRSASSVILMPNYDEYFIAYRDRGPTSIVGAIDGEKDPTDVYAHLLCVDGRFGGFWRRAIDKKAAGVELVPYRPLTRAHLTAAKAEAERFGAFLGLPSRFSVRDA
jgi:hypothetical protein